MKGKFVDYPYKVLINSHAVDKKYTFYIIHCIISVHSNAHALPGACQKMHFFQLFLHLITTTFECFSFVYGSAKLSTVQCHLWHHILWAVTAEQICVFVFALYICAKIIWATSWENQQSAYAKTKTQISFAVTAKLISAFVFATWIVQYLYFLNPKFKLLAISSSCTAWFVSDLVRNHIVGFLMLRLIFWWHNLTFNCSDFVDFMQYLFCHYFTLSRLNASHITRW